MANTPYTLVGSGSGAPPPGGQAVNAGMSQSQIESIAAKNFALTHPGAALSETNKGVFKANAPTKPSDLDSGHVLGASTTASGGGGGAAGSPLGLSSPQYLEGLRNEYDYPIQQATRVTIPFYQNYMHNLQGAATNQAAQQTADENNIFGANNNAYETQKQTVGNQAKLSLAELADQIHGQNQGLINQLGTMGAGSSSALGAGQNALAKVQNTNRADIEQNAGGATANISSAQAGLLSQHQNNLDQIANFKTNTLNQIIGYYTPLIQSAQTAAHQALGEEQRLSAMYNLKALTSQATGALANLDSSVKALTQKSLASLSAPENLSPLHVNPAPAPISAPVVSPFNTGRQQGSQNTTATPVGGSLSALMDRLQQNQ